MILLDTMGADTSAVVRKIGGVHASPLQGNRALGIEKHAEKGSDIRSLNPTHIEGVPLVELTPISLQIDCYALNLLYLLS